MNNPKNTKLSHEEVAKTPFTLSYAIKHIKLPESENIPKIICWIGPARSGTTSLLFLLAGHPQVDRAYFQPIKTLLRCGEPDFVINSKHNTICMKEVFRGCCAKNAHDPVAALQKAGVPADKITLISFIREPTSCYASWVKSFKGANPDAFIDTYLYNFKLYNRYKSKNLKVVPFSYDLLAEGGQSIVNSLLNKVGLNPLPDLKFNTNEIAKKIEYGQAKDSSYFNDLIRRTLERGEFSFTSNNHKIPANEAAKIKSACQEVYDNFFHEVKNEFAI